MARRWRETVETLARHYSSRSDLRPLFNVCASYVPIFRRWGMGLAQPIRNELWSILEETTLALYTSGPSELNLWERAGGHDVDLTTSGTGREKWHIVLRRMRSGGPVRCQTLIATMLADYPHNPTLQYLANEGFY